MTVSIQPVSITADLDRLVRFCTELLGAVETRRVPEQGEPRLHPRTLRSLWPTSSPSS